ncbi:hypothetical protein AB6A40_008087 [Gnathostoma spinigerum]|uniref:Ribosomal protein S19 n=1 Tax=Gnathostoma spinigerum TaxID=75299 RepID=A0ABD6ENC9_9BILA
MIDPSVDASRTVNGGNKRRGIAPNHLAKASGSIIRKALETLEAIKWVEKHPDGAGRILTKQGRKNLDRISSQLRQNTRVNLEEK